MGLIFLHRVLCRPGDSLYCRLSVNVQLLAKVDQLQGREVALDHLPAAWFAADLELLMREPQRKAELWAQLRRIKTRWQGKV